MKGLLIKAFSANQALRVDLALAASSEANLAPATDRPAEERSAAGLPAELAPGLPPELAPKSANG